MKQKILRKLIIFLSACVVASTCTIHALEPHYVNVASCVFTEEAQEDSVIIHANASAVEGYRVVSLTAPDGTVVVGNTADYTVLKNGMYDFTVTTETTDSTQETVKADTSFQYTVSSIPAEKESILKAQSESDPVLTAAAGYTISLKQPGVGTVNFTFDSASSNDFTGDAFKNSDGITLRDYLTGAGVDTTNASQIDAKLDFVDADKSSSLRYNTVREAVFKTVYSSNVKVTWTMYASSVAKLADAQHFLTDKTIHITVAPEYTFALTMPDKTVTNFYAYGKTNTAVAADVLKNESGTVTLRQFFTNNGIDSTNADQFKMPYGNSMYGSVMAAKIGTVAWNKYVSMLSLADSSYAAGTNQVFRGSVIREYQLQLKTADNNTVSFYVYGEDNTAVTADVLKEKNTAKTTLNQYFKDNNISMDNEGQFYFLYGNPSYTSIMASKIQTVTWDKYVKVLGLADTGYNVDTNRVFRAVIQSPYTFALDVPASADPINFYAYGDTSTKATGDLLKATITDSTGTTKQVSLREYLTSINVDCTNPEQFYFTHANSAYGDKLAAKLMDTTWDKYHLMITLADSQHGVDKVVHMTVVANYTFALSVPGSTDPVLFHTRGTQQTDSVVDVFKMDDGTTLRQYLENKDVDLSTPDAITDLLAYPYGNSYYGPLLMKKLASYEWKSYAEMGKLADSDFAKTDTLRASLLEKVVYTISIKDALTGEVDDFTGINTIRTASAISFFKDENGVTLSHYLADHGVHASDPVGYLSLPDAGTNNANTLLKDMVEKGWNEFYQEGSQADTVHFATERTIHEVINAKAVISGVTINPENPTVIDLNKINGDIVVKDNGLYIGGLKVDPDETAPNPNGYEFIGTTGQYTIDVYEGVKATLILNNISMTSNEVYNTNAGETYYPYRFAGVRNVSCINVTGADATILLKGKNTLTYSTGVTEDNARTKNGCALEKSGMDGSLVIKSYNNSKEDSLTATGTALHDGAISSSLYQADNRPDGLKNGGFANFTIESGTITANGGLHNPGIGAICHAYLYSEGTQYAKNITITGENTVVSAIGNECCAGIGSGLGTPVDGITISDGADVTAKGGICSPGIGSGGLNRFADKGTMLENLDVKNVVITGGKTVVTAIGDPDHHIAGIGTGYTSRTDVSKEFTGVKASPENGWMGYLKNGTEEASAALVKEAPFTDDYDISSLSNTDDQATYIHIYFNTRSISGTVWNDANENGLYDADESALANVKVKLQQTEDDGSTWTDVDETITNDTGRYSFAGMLTGKYRILSEVPQDMHVTAAEENTLKISDVFDDETNTVQNAAATEDTYAVIQIIDLSYETEQNSQSVEYDSDHTWYINHADIALAQDLKYWQVKFLDCKGNTVAVQKVQNGMAAKVPEGFGTYTGYQNITSNTGLSPVDCRLDPVDHGFVVPDTGSTD